MCRKDYSWDPSACIWENGQYLESVTDDSVITCDEILNTTDDISTNVTSTVSTNFDNKKVRQNMDCYILYTVQ